MNPPLVVIALLTYERTEYTLETIRAMREKIAYPNIGWYVADSGSGRAHIDAVMSALAGENLIGWHGGERRSPGANWNLGIRNILGVTDFYFRLEDDFVLTKTLLLEPYVRLLQQKQEIGMVRLGLMPINLEMESFGFEGRIYMHIYKNRQYTFSGNPGLIHRRMHEAYGFFPEDRTPGDCEVDFDGVVRTKPGPEIWWPLEAGTWGYFGHIGAEKTENK